MNINELHHNRDEPYVNYAPQPISSDGYQAALADITREQWADFKGRYLPVQRELFALANNDQLLNEQMGRNQHNIAQSFQTAKANESRRMGRYGLSAMDSQQDGNNHQLLKSLTTASVNNETRAAVDDLQTKIRTGQGGAPKTLADIGGKR